MINYSKSTPITNNGAPFLGAEAPAAALSLAENGTVNAAVSSVVTLTHDTTVIEVATAGAGGALMKWIATGDTVGSVYSISSVGATFPANFDHAIPATTVRRFIVPIESMPATGYGSVQGANRENGLYRRVAFVSGGGISSVLLTEY